MFATALAIALVAALVAGLGGLIFLGRRRDWPLAVIALVAGILGAVLASLAVLASAGYLAEYPSPAMKIAADCGASDCDSEALGLGLVYLFVVWPLSLLASSIGAALVVWRPRALWAWALPLVVVLGLTGFTYLLSIDQPSPEQAAAYARRQAEARFPHVTITSPQSSPDATSETSLSVHFLANNYKGRPVSLPLECSLDHADFSPCTSPQRYHDLRPGEHTLTVRVRSNGSITDTDPATLYWNVTRSLRPPREAAPRSSSR